MTMPGASCKAVAIQNSSEWPCSMCPFPQLRLVGVRASYIYFSNISWTPWVLNPITNPYLGPPSWLHPVSILQGGSISEQWGIWAMNCHINGTTAKSSDLEAVMKNWIRGNFQCSQHLWPDRCSTRSHALDAALVNLLAARLSRRQTR